MTTIWRAIVFVYTVRGGRTVDAEMTQSFSEGKEARSYASRLTDRDPGLVADIRRERFDEHGDLQEAQLVARYSGGRDIS